MAKRRVPSFLKILGSPEHVGIVRLGPAAIKAWRKKHADHSLDLRGADLRGLDLAGAELSRARFDAAMPDEQPTNLRRAILRKARLRAANLRMADLKGADLREADLRGSQLSIVDFSHANLEGANLSRTILIATDFHRANLGNVDLSGSIIGNTRFTEVDLSHVNGLSSLRHDRPSTMDVHTLFTSSEALPESFLQGCGVPDAVITHLRALSASIKPVQFDSCFISYSNKDRAFAERLHAALQGKGVRCWYAPEDLKIGDKFRSRIAESIQVYDKLIVVLTQKSIQSPWVEEDVEAALEKERNQNKLVLFPIRLDDAVMEAEQTWAANLRRMRHIGDFTRWKDRHSYHKAFDRLLRDLRADKTAAQTQ